MSTHKPAGVIAEKGPVCSNADPSIVANAVAPKHSTNVGIAHQALSFPALEGRGLPRYWVMVLLFVGGVGVGATVFYLFELYTTQPKLKNTKRKNEASKNTISQLRKIK